MKSLISFASYLFLLFLATITAQTHLKQNSPVSYVNPFIGTKGGGNTYPGAVIPWGMVSVSPHNTFSSPAGYINGEKYFYGFGHVHLSGVGCNDLGSIIISADTGKIKTNPEEYKTTYSKEKAYPGFYSLFLNDLGLYAEVTATKHCGLTKFYSEADNKINIFIDAGRSLSKTGGGQLTIRSGKNADGYNITGGLCGESNSEIVYFSAEFSQPAAGEGAWEGKKLIFDRTVDTKDSEVGCWFTFNFKKSVPIYVKVGISYVSVANAKENLEKEIPGWDFEKVKTSANHIWNENLSRITVEGGTKEDLTKFYTGLYHMLIHPNVISDINGEYPLMGRKGTGKNIKYEHYTVFSLWDTYRNLHPFLTLVYPERQSEILKTMIDMYCESGFLPKWELAANETYVMTGDPAAPVIADSYIKGIKDFDVQKAFEAVLKPALIKKGETAPPIRAGYHELLQYGYIPFEQDTSTAWWVWGPVSTTLEYALSDWTISRFADALGKKDIAAEFNKRSLFYRNIFDSTTQFMRPKLKNGNWLTPFDPFATEGSGSWGGSGGPGYVEGNAWNYTWFVPHDIPGLINIFGGGKNFSDKLYESFRNKQFTITNEPDIAYPYLFNYIKGGVSRTRELVKKVITEDYKTTPDGIPGNDDCGALSGWLVFSMLGFYPDCPASEYYQLGIPAFEKASIKLNKKYYKGKVFTINRENFKSNSSEPVKIILNKKEIMNFRLNHFDLVKGGTLRFIY